MKLLESDIIDRNTENGIEQLNTKQGRLYRTPEGKLYPSATTVTGLIHQKAIESWVKKVGEKRANKIKEEAGTHGTRWHELMERTLKENKPINIPFGKEFFKIYPKVIQDIYPHISDVVAIEQRLYSDEMEVAGTIDLLAKWDGVLSVIDWKTTRRFKTEKDVANYWCQTASYAKMVRERLNLYPQQLVLVFNDSDINDYVLIKPNVDSWINNFVKLRKRYKQIYHI